LLEEYPLSFYSNYLYGSLLNSTGRRDEALFYYERSLASNPEYPKSRLDIGLIEVNRGNFDRAVEELNRVLTLVGPSGPKDVRSTALYGLGAAFANKGEYTQALRSLDDALEVFPGNIDATRLKSSIEQVAHEK
jgi:tetratricopeptide (TPR) repeat protein